MARTSGKRSIFSRRCFFEPLERRTLLSASFEPAYLLCAGANGGQSPSAGAAGLVGDVAPADGTLPPGLSPQQLRKAYGVDSIFLGALQGDGSGQTIAIVDAGDQPNIASDLHTFDQEFGIADPPSFTKVDGDPGWSISADSSWGAEESLDVEWAHAIAPEASIVLVECYLPYTPESLGSHLFTAVNYARNLPGVNAVSMSWGCLEGTSNPEEVTEAQEQQYDAVLTTPAGHAGITFLACTGDSGAISWPGGSAAGWYPAFSPKAVAVGGTTLTTEPDGTYVSETGWSLGAVNDPGEGTGGGPSIYEPEPTYQSLSNAQSSGMRETPDVAMDADPHTGVAVYDTYQQNGWMVLGGTSVSTHCWAGLIAIADQLRQNANLPSLDGATQTLPALYDIYSDSARYAADFHDITSGFNGYNAATGYDMVTGLGTPKANVLVPDLASSSPRT